MSKKTTTFDDRMKCYENAYRTYLPKRLPVLIRIDGKAFHTYTKGMDKPLDSSLFRAMSETCKYPTEDVGNKDRRS